VGLARLRLSSGAFMTAAGCAPYERRRASHQALARGLGTHEVRHAFRWRIGTPAGYKLVRRAAYPP
jgi:hypothetical protein